MEIPTWQCKYCRQFLLLDPRQRGSHTTNCLSNPKRTQILAALKQRSNWKIAKQVFQDKTEKKRISWIQEATESFSNWKTEPLFNLGVGLYWGEGNKAGQSFQICNTDPAMLRIWLKWLDTYSKGYSFRLSIIAHSDVVESEAKEFWLKELNLPHNTACTYYVSSPRLSKGIAAKSKRIPYGTLQIVMQKGSAEYHAKMMQWILLAGISK